MHFQLMLVLVLSCSPCFGETLGICPDGHGCPRLNLRAALSHGVRLGSSEASGIGKSWEMVQKKKTEDKGKKDDPKEQKADDEGKRETRSSIRKK